MPRIFPRKANAIARGTLILAVLLLVGVFTVLSVIQRSPYSTGVGVAIAQPIPFSHKHHVSDDGIDCRYCHTTVETSSFAGIPATDVCMNCHRQIWNESPMLEPVRESYRTGRPIVWNRVNDLPDFVYFDHSIHINKGIGCSSCHGRIDRMPLTAKGATLEMEFCLECHRHPERHVRPRDQVFNMAYQPPPDQVALGQRLVKEYRISIKQSCDTCHR